MKTMTKKLSRPLCAGMMLGLLAVNVRADDAASCNAKAACCQQAGATAGVQTESEDGIESRTRVEAKADHLATLLTQRTKKVAHKTQAATTRVVQHVKNDVRKVGNVAKKISDKVGQKIDNLTE